jgi:hypothetical protein
VNDAGVSGRGSWPGEHGPKSVRVGRAEVRTTVLVIVDSTVDVVARVRSVRW